MKKIYLLLGFVILFLIILSLWFFNYLTLGSKTTLPSNPNHSAFEIKTNNYAIRDDVHQYILSTYPNSIRTQKALLQYAKAFSAAVFDAQSLQLSKIHNQELLDAIVCFGYSSPELGSSPLKLLRANILNTRERIDAYSKYNSYFTSDFTEFPSENDAKKSCSEDPDLLK